MPPVDPPGTGGHTAAEVHQYPKPLLRLQLPDLGHAGARAFLGSVNAEDALRRAVETVLGILYPGHRPPGQEHADTPFPRRTPWPSTRSVTLIIDPYADGVAFTTGKHLDNDHKEIHLMANYVSGQSPERVAAEIHGVLVHEMVHCWQWAAQGTANGGLIEGIADWVRLRANLGPPHWRRRNGGDVSWDSGYETTAYFLDWLENERCGPGTVVRLNENLRDCTSFQADDFFQRVVGEKVSRLWEQYRQIPM